VREKPFELPPTAYEIAGNWMHIDLERGRVEPFGAKK
jgi:hypothetical protein